MKTRHNKYSKLASKTALAIIISGLVACGGGGGGDGGSTEPPPPPPPPPPPTAVDTDNDGLTDDEEAALGTNPTVTDTDGDGFLDKEEADNWDQNSGTHLLFNPLVADVPRIRIERLGAPVIQLFAETTESGSVNRGMTNASLSEVQVTTDRGRTNTNVIEEQHAVGVNAEVARDGPVTSGSVSASYNYQHTDTTTETDYWNEQTVDTNRRESSEYYETLRTETVTLKGGEIKIVMGLLNDGDVSYTLNNMDLSAFMEDPQRPGNLISVGTLVFDGDMNFTPDPLGTTINPSPGDYTPFNFRYVADNNPEEISRILENSNQLVLKPVNLSLTGQRSDVDLNLSAQNVRARTAEVIIDFGESQNPKSERYRVAIDTGNGDTLSFTDVMTNRLNFGFNFSEETFTGKTESHTGLSSIRSQAMNTNTNSYWLVAHTFTPAGSPAGTTETKLYNILFEDYSASDISLRKGDVLHLVYITDTDLDGLSDRLEILKGTDLDVADTDGDGLDDAREVYGWFSNLNTAPCNEGDNLSLVFSNPLNADTDGDGNNDFAEFENCTNPQGELMVDVEDMLLTDTSSTVTLTATVSNFQNSSSLRYNWMQTGGESVGQLSNTASISFSAPANVDKLEFDVTVTDTDQTDVSAMDTVAVFVLEDKTNAVFIDPDTGHDFDSTGRTPDSPIRTIPRALEASFAGSDIYLNTPDSGSYEVTETIVLPVTTSLYGGFDVDWEYQPGTAPTPIMVSQAVALSVSDFTSKTISGISIEASAPDDGQVHSRAIFAGSGNNLILKDIIAQSSDLTTEQPDDNDISSFIAGSSYGVFAMNLERLDVIDSIIKAGNGANGVEGRKGNNGAPGDRGSNGSGSNGGSGGAGVSSGSADGGAGAAAVKLVVACTGGNGGSKGGNGTSNSGTIAGGAGGAAGTATVVFPFGCSMTGGGGGGSVSTSGKTGTQGVAGLNSNTFNNAVFIPSQGISLGGKAAGGAGGGGGGSGPGNNADDGGGGGGGGEGGEGGNGGNVGRGGGGSFGLALSSVNFISITNSEIVSNNGGIGGAGGNGGTGGAGGGGGTGGDVGARKGGSGGSGSPGGRGGAGGGGAGGPVAAILLLDGSELDIVDSQITTGFSGNGTNANRGQGGWNYGIFVKDSTISTNENNTFGLGASGNDAEAPAEINP